MADIVLTTLNAKYIHCAFGLRYLFANLGELRSRASLVEFQINDQPLDIVSTLIRLEPKIIGFGVYIWNVTQTEHVVSVLKRLRPEITVVLGGPEVSYETEEQDIVKLADYVITGEGDIAFAALSAAILSGCKPSTKIIAASLPDLSKLELPYQYYSDEDISRRVIYVEASRGCPFTCEFCLSSVDLPVRAFALERFLGEMGTLLQRGARNFKFVDRTFNLHLATSKRILEFFLERYLPGLFLHFEMIPDRLPEPLKELILRFPSGVLQFEIGVQTFNEAVSERIRRRQNNVKLEENFRFLRESTGVYIHADLIVGLPGESLASFAEGFDRLVRLAPQEIQVGILKRLRGTSIGRHDAEWGMVFSPEPPYEVLESAQINFAEMERLRRFARYWDLIANSGNFQTSVALIWEGGSSPFQTFLDFSDWLYHRFGTRHGIALRKLTEAAFEYLVQVKRIDRLHVARVLHADCVRSGHRREGGFLEEHIGEGSIATPQLSTTTTQKRQKRRALACEIDASVINLE